MTMDIFVVEREDGEMILTDKEFESEKNKIDRDENDLRDAIDIQAILQILVEKNIVTREEVNEKREFVRKKGKYRDRVNELERRKENIKRYKSDKRSYLEECFGKYMKQ